MYVVFIGIVFSPRTPAVPDSLRVQRLGVQGFTHIKLPHCIHLSTCFDLISSSILAWIFKKDSIPAFEEPSLAGLPNPNEQSDEEQARACESANEEIREEISRKGLNILNTTTNWKPACHTPYADHLGLRLPLGTSWRSWDAVSPIP